jgi:hypothetical protein
MSLRLAMLLVVKIYFRKGTKSLLLKSQQQQKEIAIFDLFTTNGTRNPISAVLQTSHVLLQSG